MNHFYVSHEVLIIVSWGFLDILSLQLFFFCLEPFQMAIDIGIHFFLAVFLPSILLGNSGFYSVFICHWQLIYGCFHRDLCQTVCYSTSNAMPRDTPSGALAGF